MPFSRKEGAGVVGGISADLHPVGLYAVAKLAVAAMVGHAARYHP